MLSTDKTVPKGFGTMDRLAKRTGVHIRQLYRMRELGVFKTGRRLGTRSVFYDIERCADAIERYATTGKLSWR